MSTQLLPTTGEVHQAFSGEVSKLGGVVTNAYDDGEVLLLRATVPSQVEVKPKDVVQAGVALRTTSEQVFVHPYVFREVCRNGAIWAHATGEHSIPRVNLASSSEQIEEVLEEVRETVQMCAGNEAFGQGVREMRQAAAMPGNVDLLLNIMAALPNRNMAQHVVRQIVRRFERDGDESAFGLMNAVTSIARDTPDERTRWRLEELGGAVPAPVRPIRRPSTGAVPVRV